MNKLKISFNKYLSILKDILDKNDLALSLVIACSIIAIAVFIGSHNNQIVLPYPHSHYRYSGHNFLGFMSNWDGVEYLNIARHGYSSINLASFFPLYPLLIKGLHFVVPSYLISSLIISWAAFSGAIYYYIKILKHLKIVDSQAERIRSVLFFVLFPTAIFFIAGFTESLYAFLTLGSIYYAFRKKILLSSILIFLACLCHITGVFLILLIVLILLEEKVKLYKIISPLILGSLGILSFMIYLKARFNDPLEFIHAQVYLHGWLNHTFLSMLKSTRLMNAVFIILILLSAKFYWKTRKSFSIYSLSFLLIPIIGKQYGGFNRYVLMVFPIYFMLYEYFKNKRQIYFYFIIGTSILWTYIALQYMGGYIGS